VNTTPQGRNLRLRKPALAAMSVAALGATAIAPVSADAQTPPTIKFKAKKNVLAGKNMAVRGLVAGPAGQRVYVERTVGNGWKRVGKAVTRSGGRFRVTFPARNLGRMKVRAVARNGAQSETRSSFVYRRTFASYYGPGLYGNKLACGGTLTPSTIGVAHKSLPCGTKVRFQRRAQRRGARDRPRSVRGRP